MGISAAAVHEAGHVAVALTNNIPVLHVSLETGWVDFTSANALIKRGRNSSVVAMGFALTAVAGAVASPETKMSPLDRQLFRMAVRLGDWPESDEPSFRQVAAKEMAEHRALIERLAGIIDQRRILSGDEVTALWHELRSGK